MEEVDRYIRFDWAIMRLLRQKANFGVLEGFLTVLLGEVKIIGILESENNQQTINDKLNRIDIKAYTSKGENIIVEVRNIRELHYLERILGLEKESKAPRLAEAREKLTYYNMSKAESMLTMSI